MSQTWSPLYRRAALRRGRLVPRHRCRRRWSRDLRVGRCFAVAVEDAAVAATRNVVCDRLGSQRVNVRAPPLVLTTVTGVCGSRMSSTATGFSRTPTARTCTRGETPSRACARRWRRRWRGDVHAWGHRCPARPRTYLPWQRRARLGRVSRRLQHISTISRATGWHRATLAGAVPSRSVGAASGASCVVVGGAVDPGACDVCTLGMPSVARVWVVMVKVSSKRRHHRRHRCGAVRQPAVAPVTRAHLILAVEHSPPAIVSVSSRPGGRSVVVAAEPPVSVSAPLGARP